MYSRITVTLFFAASVCLAEPKLLSIHPFTVQRGTPLVTSMRGTGLTGASSVYIARGFEAEVQSVSKAEGKPAAEIATVKLAAAATLEPGRYDVRLVTPTGVSNALPIHVVDRPVLPEPEGLHEEADQAVAVAALPAIYAARIDKRGEADFYAFEAKAGETITFEVLSGLPSSGAPGGNARGFDPAISIYDTGGSWFDSKRVNRLAANDEPLWMLGQATDAYLVHTFPKAGRYLLRVEAFSGQGGPDYGYQLKILPGRVPQDRAPARDAWQERNFSRKLSSNRLNLLAERGGKPGDGKAVESYRGDRFQLPATIEGTVAAPGQTHRARFQIDKPADIAIEVETPAAAPPIFNPVVRLLDPKGEEVATTFFAGRGACTGALGKSLQSKAVLALRDTGEYTVEIRDITSDFAGADFVYRVQVRPQVPHLGQIAIDADVINLARGDAKTVRVNFDREEDYRGAVAVTAESLPPGVQVMTGADFEPDKDPPRYPGKRERYTARAERTVLVFTAPADAPLTATPQVVRVAVRPVNGGKPGAIIASKEIPFMVVAKP